MDEYFNLLMDSVETPGDVNFRIEWKEGRGRCLVATTTIQPGQIIFREKCVVKGPLHNTSPVCLNCLSKVSGEYKCSDCYLPLCKPECKGDHQTFECNLFQLAKNKIDISDFTPACPLYQCITPLRCLLTRDNWPEKYIKIKGQEAHREKAEVGEHWSICQTNIDYLIKSWKLDFSRNEINHVIGCLEVNSFEINLVKGGRGRGVFPLLALLSHSCVSNVKYVYEDTEDGGWMTCAATVLIREGEELLDHYISNLESTIRRRQFLRHTLLI
ncbi:protein msta isoform X2 [Eurytemora carolleeae]|uniref:protein msta isoform X2 n=1 Tax=Eurytemora carolleeae TaxID=1294199 RepID=UPI000C774B23|nr:protein msta isoform X2 [Eurytemora carolleeae]|eukprot:XP_023338881.1 protein msta-like isoform X2 [Eurytemora affinis]